MITVQAFYYDVTYFMMPEGALTAGVPLAVTVLREVGCMAPYFTVESLSQETVTVDDLRRVYPVTAFVMPAAEYDDRLREIVVRQCPGCIRYGEDATDLSGHHEEVSLSGQCLEREEQVMREGLLSPYEPAYAVEDFWLGFIKIQKVLQSCINRGDFIQAVGRLSVLLGEVELQEYVFPALSKYLYKDPQGHTVTRYVLMLTGGGIPGADLMASYFVRRMPPALADHWDVYPYAVRGFYTQFPMFTGCNPEEDPPLLQVTYLEQQDVFGVRMFVAWQDEEVPANVFCANYMYLCQVIGEDRLRGAVLEMMPFPKSEMVFEGDCVTAQEFSDMIDTQIQDQQRLAPPRCTLRSLDMEGMQEQRRVSHLITYCEQLSFDFILGFEGPSQYLWEGEIALGALFVPAANLTHDDDSVYLSSLLSHYLYDTYHAEPIDVCTGPDGVYFDFIVLHKVHVRKALRNLAPVLRHFGATYREQLGEQYFEYPVDFDLAIPDLT